MLYIFLWDSFRRLPPCIQQLLVDKSFVGCPSSFSPEHEGYVQLLTVGSSLILLTVVSDTAADVQFICYDAAGLSIDAKTSARLAECKNYLTAETLECVVMKFCRALLLVNKCYHTEIIVHGMLCDILPSTWHCLLNSVFDTQDFALGGWNFGLQSRGRIAPTCTCWGGAGGVASCCGGPRV
jgi:hypothetical protein